MTRTWLVVDSSVARACSPPAEVAGRRGTEGASTEADRGTGVGPLCTGTLQALHDRAVEKKDVGVAMSRELKDEWQRHRSRFASKWLQTMVARKAWKKVDRPWPDLPDFRQEAGALGPSKARELEKDEHLVSLAMQTSQRVLSLDDSQRALLVELLDAAPKLVALRALHWANPVDEAALDWVGKGLPITPGLQLGADVQR